MTEQLTAQDIFDTVVDHLYAQGRQAVDSDGTCAYRGKDGLKCAVGCVIRDDEYVPEMECKAVTTLCRRNLLPERLVPFKSLLEDLQEAHDASACWDSIVERPTPGLAVALYRAAQNHSLSDGKVREHFPDLDQHI